MGRREVGEKFQEGASQKAGREPEENVVGMARDEMISRSGQEYHMLRRVRKIRFLYPE